MPSSYPPTDEQVAAVSLNSLAMLGGGFTVDADGTLEYRGQRPGLRSAWHVHGWLERWIWVIVNGRIERRRLRKRRWLRVQLERSVPRTGHSRPPDDLGSLHSCALIVALKLWAWLNGAHGLHNTREVNDELDTHVCRRTVQRWLRRACGKAMGIQQAIRRAVIERCEPRPVEQLFPRGLSPPESLMRRRWRDPAVVSSLHRAFAILLTAAVKLNTPTTVLLAEARGR